MAAQKSMANVAYEALSKRKKAVPFAKLWEEVSKTCKVSNDKVAQFYSDLTLDPRFVTLKDNKWDLVERLKYDECHVDLSEIELDDDEYETEEDPLDPPNIENY